MQTRLFSIFLIPLLLSTLFPPNTFAQDYTQLNLPEGAKARLGKGVITDIQLSVNGKYLAVASSIGVWLYDVNTGSETALIIGHTEAVTHVAFSPDGKILASSGSDKIIRLWRTETGESLLSLSPPTNPIHLKFSADGKTLIGKDRKGTVSFWDTTTGEQLNTFTPNLPKIRLGKDRIWSFATDAFIDQTVGFIFAVGNKDGTISIQDGRTGREMRKLIVQADDSSALPIQSPRPYTYKRKIIDGQPATKWVNGLNFSPDGKTLVNGISYQVAHWDGSSSGRGGPTELWDVETGEQLAVFPYGIGATFSGDGKTVAIKAIGGKSDCAIWDIATRRKIAEFPLTLNIRFSGDGKTLAIIEKDSYKIWNVATRSEIASHNPVVEWFEISPERFMLSQDGTLLVTADEYGTVAVRETKNAKQLRLAITDYTKPFTALTFSHDGKTIASGDSSSTIHLWDTHTGAKQNTIKAAAYRIEGLAFAIDNTTLTTANDQEDIIQWNIATSEQVAAHTLPNTNISMESSWFDDGTSYQRKGVTFAPNSEKLAVKNMEKSPIESFDTTIEIWDITTDKPPRHLIEFVTDWGPIAFTPDGSILASGSDSHAATDLWSTHTGKRIATLKTPGNWINDLLVRLRLRDSSIYALAFTHDGNTLAVGTRDKHIQLWNVTDQQHIGSLEGHKYVVCELAFSPDGNTLASGDTGGKIHLWELPTRRHLTIFNGHKSYVRTLAFAPDGKTLASISGHDGTIFLWNVPSK
ncbi:MAG: WD40 repeat domain-containing protein [Candidatus Poribacteria bacterium]|nr:WD40 repeat domain-containing protein [Candidatus Poribacteria bacterium]